MKKQTLFSAALAVALSTAAVTDSVRGEFGQLDTETAALFRFDGGAPTQSYHASPYAVEMLEYGGEFPAIAHKGQAPCGGCPHSHIWVGGVDLLMLRPHVHGIRYNRSIAEVEGERTDSADYSLDEMTYSPRVWFGRQGECWGLLTRLWYLSESNMSHDPYHGVAAGDLITTTAGNSITMYTIDLEVNRRLSYRCWDMNLGVGVRHGSLEVGSQATRALYQDVPNFDYISSAYTKSQIDATGVTIGLDGRRQILPCHNLSLFWGLRGSVLWGETDLEAVAHSIISDPAAEIASDYRSYHETLFVGEVQLGVTWEHRLSCLPANVFVKLAAEYQYWGSDGTPIWNEAFATVPTGQFSNSLYDADSPSVSLFGLNLGVGLTWGGCCNSSYKH